jgi:nitrite reductase (NADH) large subunit
MNAGPAPEPSPPGVGPAGIARRLVIVGNGMVGHKLAEALTERDVDGAWKVTIVGEEARYAYDRVALSSYFSGASEADLRLTPLPARVDVVLNDAVSSIDRVARVVTTVGGRSEPYDSLVLATGSSAFVPPIPGNDLPGCFVYRTLDDLDAIRERVRQKAQGASGVGVVIGGGLLGLEAANALVQLGLVCHVVEFAPRLMPVQLDEAGGAVLRARIEGLGVHVHVGTSTSELVPGPDGSVSQIRFADGTGLDVDIVVFSAGIRPRDELARTSGLVVAERGGVAVDAGCQTSDPAVWAVGECAHTAGRVWGLVAPGFDMARTVADRLMGGSAQFEGAELSTKLKLLGIDVASFGDAFGTTPGAQSITFADPVAQVYKRLVVDAAGTRVLGGMLVGDASAYTVLVQMARGDMPTPPSPEQLIFPGSTAPPETGISALADAAVVCSCNNVSKGSICGAIRDGGLTDIPTIKAATRAGSTCGGCVPLVTQLLRDELRKAGTTVRNDLCEHFPFSRQELFDLVRIQRISTFAELLARYGAGRGCEICKPTVASILASIDGSYILDGERASLQDTNDHFLANIQRDGTYSVVPRVPGGEITPDQLIVIGAVAKEFGLYTKITGGQRIDLFGARVDQLPAIWERLIDAGMESGHAYGKALRTVKSCVGSTWCRYGVQDSTAMAIRLELRYRGLRAPHKLKSAVSGCARECAEAQSKDFGVIATERGWNLWVCGNGGMRPRHADLLAEDLNDDELIRYIDRFLMFYIRTADRLERTSMWLDRMEGGIEHLRRVVVDDVLGIGTELELAIAATIEGYECEWAATVRDPIRSARFATFVNAPGSDPHVVKVSERGQPRPATRSEKPPAPESVSLSMRARVEASP